MPNYQNGKIYKLVSNVSDKVYYGSTTQSLSLRKSGHKKTYNKIKKGDVKRGKVSSFDLFEEGDVDIVLIENFPCESKEELHARERHYIENNECLNKNIPGRTRKEWKEQNKWRRAIEGKKYRERYPEKIEAKKDKVECQCGAIVSKSVLKRHQSRDVHKDAMFLKN